MVDLAAVGWSGLLYGAGFGLTAASLLVSCWIDLRYRLVCDEACLAAFIGGVLMMFGGRSLGSLWYWAALLAVVVVLALLFAARLLGGGDLKLMAALLPASAPGRSRSSWCGPASPAASSRSPTGWPPSCCAVATRHRTRRLMRVVGAQNIRFINGYATRMLAFDVAKAYHMCLQLRPVGWSRNWSDPVVRRGSK